MDLKFRALRADEVECRIGTFKEGKGASLLLYKTARVDMDLLDEVVGPMNWQRKHELIDGQLFCSVGIYRPETGEWVWKQDVGVEAKTEAEKSRSSDAFKRACFNIGIGRELYTAPFIWIEGAGKYDRFYVSEMDVEDKKITRLVITDKRGVVAFSYPKGEKTRGLTSSKIKVLKDLLDQKGVNIPALLAQYKVDGLTSLTESQYADIMRRLKNHEQ